MEGDVETPGEGKNGVSGSENMAQGMKVTLPRINWEILFNHRPSDSMTEEIGRG